MSAILVKMPPATRKAAAARDSPTAKPMKQGPGVVAGDEQQDRQHEDQLDADQDHADAHAGHDRHSVDGVRQPGQRGHGRPAVGERVDADAEPAHAVAAGDADQAAGDDRGHLGRPQRVAGGVGGQEPEVGDQHGPDEHLQQQDERQLAEQVRLARGVDRVADGQHGPVDGHGLEAAVERDAEGQPEHRHEQAGHEQPVAAEDAEEAGVVQVRHPQVGVGRGGDGRADQQRQHGDGEQRQAGQSRRHGRTSGAGPAGAGGQSGTAAAGRRGERPAVCPAAVAFDKRPRGGSGQVWTAL